MQHVSSTISEHLARDHTRLHALLAAATAAEALDREAFAAFRAGLLRHIAIEEKLLLPAARRARSGVALERARELRIDHGALAALLVPTPDFALCSEILALLTIHDAKEEGPGGVYAECESLLTPAESAELAARAAAFPDIRAAAHFDGHGVHRTAADALASGRSRK